MMSENVIHMLCIRDPDGPNEYVSDAPDDTVTITIDIGGQWTSYSDFAACLTEGDEDALEYEASVLQDVAHLDPLNPVREAAEAFFQGARNDA